MFSVSLSGLQFWQNPIWKRKNAGNAVFHARYWLLCSIVPCLFTACCSPLPKLDENFVPETYLNDSITWSKSSNTTDPIRTIPINDNRELNRQIIAFWKRGDFNGLFSKSHPVKEVIRQDIASLKSFLNDVLAIYYVSMKVGRDLPFSEFSDSIRTRIRCEPLSNLEIRFLMNSQSTEAFPQKPLTMLMISAHELLQQRGGVPVYPKVFSSYLRTKYGYSRLKPPESINLFATKKKDIVYSKNFSGFVVCRREQNN